MIHAPTKGKHHAIRYCLSDKIFLGFNWLILTLFLIVLAYPLLYIVVSSFSSIPITGISLIPQRPSFDGYTAVFNYRYIWIGYANSLKYLVLGTFIALFVTVCCAYPLSRSDCKGGKYVMAACIFTMYFSGGMIPSFLWIKNLGFLDTVWALVLPGCLSVYNMIVMRTYFKNNIPTELHEASQLDGCNDYRFIWSIVLPLSGPILAVIGLYYAVSLWTGYFNAMLYIRTRTKLPLSMFLREILVLNQSSGVDAGMDPTQMEIAEARAQLMKYSLIIVSSLPVMIIYPFVQRYFVKGVMVGAVKG